jgi:acetylornithine deacetylase
VNELYSFDEVLQTITQHVKGTVKPRSCRLKSSIIPVEHPLVQAGIQMGKTYYGSPTTSDKALMPFPALKMGPGNSARSHTADEYIYLSEIMEGIDAYIGLLTSIL